MPVVSFQFSPSATRAAQDRILKRLRTTPGVRSVGRIDSQSDDKEIARMCFAETTDASLAASVVGQLHHFAGVDAQTVSVEPQRGL